MGDCDSILKVNEACELECAEGYEFVERMKRTGPAGLGVRVKVPRHPLCRVNVDEAAASELVRSHPLSFTFWAAFESGLLTGS